MTVLYIAGQQPGTGATAVSAALAVVWRRAGKSVALVKPAFLNGDPSGTTALFAQITGVATDAAPVMASDGQLTSGQMDAIAKEIEALASGVDVVVVDGLPRTDADGGKVAASAQLAQRLGAVVLGVLPYSRSDGAETAAAWREAFGDALRGVVGNRRTRYAGHDAHESLVPSLQAAGVSVIGTVPEERRLLAPSLAQVAEHLGGKFYVSPYDDVLIEHFLIGGLILEWGVNYFNRFPNQAVIVRANRPDIAMAALSCTPACIVLTGGAEPAQYVYQRAQDEEVPLLAVNTDTIATEEALESLQDHVNVHHPAKAERFAEVLTECLDWDALEAAITAP
ncbi:MAG: DRTGG domain-containing protein [Chloroflexi bacterium]|nr:DRTGG domain-containing protein [Chloroflexota bacterium]